MSLFATRTHVCSLWRALSLSFLTTLLACTADTPVDRFDFGLPSGISAPPVPADNPMSSARVALGQRLFFDTRLSSTGQTSCASCHRPELAFSDGLPVARGLAGEPLPRNTPSLANVAYLSTLTWSNPRLQNLEGQALVPLLATRPRELGLAHQMPVVLAKLRADSSYASDFAAAFPGQTEPVSTAHLVAALASFERTLLSFSAPYDAFLAGHTSALSPAALRGKQLFESSRLGCANCHRGRLLTDAAESDSQVEPPFHNIGLYNLAGRGLYPRDNPGLYELTREPADMGKFRTPSLRNVALTAPYMHDGSLATLDDVLDHYAAGGRTLYDGPHAGSGHDSPLKDARIAGFLLRTDERADLLAFLSSLTDEVFVRRASAQSLRADRSARR